jgi:hypothetical protein
MENDSIAEVRGVAAEQNLDPYISDVVSKKLEEFPDGKLYQKKSSDMKRLTAIEYKTTAGQELISDDLTFLYEINSPIEGFGYEKDPRIEEIRSQRNPEEDMLVIFDCEPAQIAHTASQINENTKAFVGRLESGIFGALQKHHVEHVYTTFPERRIRFGHLEIGGKSETEIELELKEKNIQVTGYASSMIRNPDFVPLKNPEEIDLVRLRVADLGFPAGSTTKEIFEKAKRLGLALCPAEVGPRYRLVYENQPMDDWAFIGMEPLAGSDGGPSVFRLGRDGRGTFLRGSWAEPGGHWTPGYEFIFTLSK